MKAYLFDVDGVLSDPTHKRVTEPELFDHIISQLQSGNPVCLNTGRSLAWMEERVLAPLLDLIKDVSILERFMAVGEKGGSWLNFDKEGNKIHERDTSISVPAQLQKDVRKIVESQFSDSMFYDETKETMISVEMHDKFDIPEFQKAQKKLDKKLEELLTQHDISDHYVLEPSIIATDIQNEFVGKALGADRFLQYLQLLEIKPDEYIAFGDSKSDIEMTDELAKRGEKVEFVFVGDKEKLNGVTRDYPIHFVSGFTQGTLEYLNKLETGSL